jgi:hypothetical protein
MGFLDFLKGEKKFQCPNCGADGAKKAKDGGVLCPNRFCPNFDRGLEAAAPSANWTQAAKGGGFAPARPITIRYRNFQNQDKVFTADADGTVRKKNHLVARVAPTGKKIVLSRDRIQNLSEVESVLPQKVEREQAWPSRRERQVLIYHKKHGTTSPLYEKVRAKYPNW